jgi:hypothetical protein
MSAKLALYGVATVVLATAANLAHGITHLGHEVPLTAWQSAYVIVIVFIAPIAAAGLLLTRYRRAGALLLLASMVGSLIFGLAYHFVVSGPDNAFTTSEGAWHTPFLVSAALLVVVEGLGCLVGAWAFVGLSRPSTGRSRTRSTAGSVGSG